MASRRPCCPRYRGSATKRDVRPHVSRVRVALVKSEVLPALSGNPGYEVMGFRCAPIPDAPGTARFNRPALAHDEIGSPVI
jgi:hypothetical protein